MKKKNMDNCLFYDVYWLVDIIFELYYIVYNILFLTKNYMIKSYVLLKSIEYYYTPWPINCRYIYY